MGISSPADIIALRAPSLAGDARLSDLISLASLQTGTVYGANYNLAVALRVLHWLTMESRTPSGRPGQPGAIASETEGSLSHSFAQPAAKLTELYPDLMSTSFGQELVGLVRASVPCFLNRMM